MITTESANLHWADVLRHPFGAGKPSHLVQFFQTEAFLAEAVALYAGSGLRAGNSALLISTPSRRDLFRQRLGYSEALDWEGKGRLCMLDASATLDGFMAGGKPDWERFEAKVGRLLDSLHYQFGPVRAYGDMVGILRARMDEEGCQKLEEFWNRLAEGRNFALLCGYDLATFSQRHETRYFRRLAGAHTHVLPAESYLKISGPRDQFREIAQLQQKALAFERGA